MTEAQPDIGLGKRHRPFADGFFLGNKPGIFLGLPHILCAAEHKKKIVAVERRNRLALPQPDRLRHEAVLGEEVHEPPRIVMVHMLEDERAFHRQRTLGRTKALARHCRSAALALCRRC